MNYWMRWAVVVVCKLQRCLIFITFQGRYLLWLIFLWRVAQPHVAGLGAPRSLDIFVISGALALYSASRWGGAGVVKRLGRGPATTTVTSYFSYFYSHYCCYYYHSPVLSWSSLQVRISRSKGHFSNFLGVLGTARVTYGFKTLA